MLKIAILVVCATLASCYRSGSNSKRWVEGENHRGPTAELDLKAIKKRGVLKAVVDNSSTGYFLYKGQPMGYEYDLLDLFAKYLKVRLEVHVTTSIDEAFEMVNNGEVDIIAYSLAVTKERKKHVAFTKHHYTTRQVLIQRKPSGWPTMKRDDYEKKLIRSQVSLIGKEVHVRKSSSFLDRLHNLSHEIGGDIIIIEQNDSMETEKLTKMVADGVIDYTISDESQASVNAVYYNNIDIKTPISFPQQIAWAVRKNAPELLRESNRWLGIIKRQPTYNIIYKRYFESPRASLFRAKSDFSSIGGNKISRYDEQIKQGADSLSWDWLLLASQIYQESKFDPNAKSWAGAQGLMQVMPATGKNYGVKNLYDPHQSIKAGVNYLRYLDKVWAKTIRDSTERIKFVMASYNVGLGHVIDARELARKYGKDPLVWDDNVEYYLLMKSNPKFFRDSVVKSGYCRGREPVNYVRDILGRYEQYKQLVDS